MIEGLRLREGVEDYIGSGEVQARTKEMGQYFADRYKRLGISVVHLVALADGGVFFGVDLMRAMVSEGIDVRWSTLKTQHKGAGTEEDTKRVIVFNPLSKKFNPRDKHILFGDDVLDGLHTIARVTSDAYAGGAASVCVASLCEKPEGHDPNVVFNADDVQVGFRVAKRYLVGCGMNADDLEPGEPGLYRGLPYITVAEKQANGLYVPVVRSEPAIR